MPLELGIAKFSLLLSKLFNPESIRILDHHRAHIKKPALLIDELVSIYLSFSPLGLIVHALAAQYAKRIDITTKSTCFNFLRRLNTVGREPIC